MIGVADHSRMRRATSTPSMSGRPRSRRITAGARVAASTSACAPVRASTTR